jgi:peptidoglycan/LPS O-acetylase OafA/YrhL
MNLLLEVLYLALPLTLLFSGSAVIVRFRRSRGDERQQIKWFAYAVAVMVSLFLFWFSLALAGLVPPDALLWTVPLLGLPAGVGVSVLRYRLYDVDRIINLTLVYALLTGVLALIYAGSVVALQRVFAVLAGEDSRLAVVVSTLVISALFNPFRRRIQAFIDRRFYRSRYDAKATLEAAGARLRDETDLDRLGDELVAVVSETVRPARASLWMREPAQGPRETAARDGDAAGER